MTKNIVKVIASACFILITVATLLAWGDPAKGYEVSIYKETPILTWLCCGIALLFSIGIIVHQAIIKNKNKKLWILGFVGILLCNTLVLSLHIIRGYAFWFARGDPGSHVGEIIRIIDTGHFASDNIYPAIHTFVAEFVNITSTQVNEVAVIIPVLFKILGIVYIYLWAKALFSSRSQVLLTVIIGAMLVSDYHLNLTPNHCANYLFPFFMFIIAKTLHKNASNFEWLFLFILIAFLMPLFHVLPAMALFVIFMSIIFSQRYFKKAVPEIQNSWQVNKMPWPSGLILIIWSIVWISEFKAWEFFVKNLYYSLIGVREAGAAYGMLEEAISAARLGYNVYLYFLKDNFDLVIFILLSFISLPFVIKQLRHSGKQNKSIYLYAPLSLFCLLFGLSLFLNIEGVIRVTAYIIILSVPLAGYMLSNVLKFVRTRKWQAVLIVSIFLTVFSGFSIMKVYPSPYLHTFNGQTTYGDIRGMTWFFNKSEHLDISGMKIAPGRMADFLAYSTKRREYTIGYPNYIPESLQEPVYSAYEHYPYLGSAYKDNAYLLFNEMDRLLYLEIWPELEGVTFKQENFALFEVDPSLAKIYDNNGFNAYYVYSMAAYDE